MGELFNFANNTFVQNLIFLVVLGLLVAILIVILYIVLKRLIGNRDVKIGDWVKIEGAGNKPDKQIAKEDVVILDKKELSKTLTKIKGQLIEIYGKDSIETIRETVDAVINFQEVLYIITNRISEIYEGLLLMSKDNVIEIFMDQELMKDFNDFRNVLINARIYTVKKMASIVCKSIEEDKILRDDQLDGIAFKTLVEYISSKYNGKLVPRKDLIDKIKDIAPSVQATINAKYKDEFVYKITKKGIEKEKMVVDLIRKLFSEIYRARPN